MPADVENAFDIAFWFADTALNENEYLQPQKLQRLLFIAQAYYTVAFNGRKLMPAVFIAEEMGPIEPNIYIAFSKGRPDIDARLFLPHDVETFLDGIWRRFGHHSAERLNKMNKAGRGNAKRQGAQKFRTDRHKKCPPFFRFVGDPRPFPTTCPVTRER